MFSLQQLGACGRGKVSRPIINSCITSCDGEQGAFETLVQRYQGERIRR